MATPLKITLELDDKGVIAGIKTATAETKNLAAAANKASQDTNTAFNKMSDGIDGAITRLKGLAAAYLGISTIRASFEFANQIDDLAAGTGLSTEKVLQFRQALVASGGDAESAARLITSLQNALQGARDGSAGAQEQLLKLGLSFKDMASADFGGNLDKVIVGLSKMTDPVERNALAFQLLGKQAARIQWDKVAAETAKSADGFSETAANIAKAADLMNNFSLQLEKFKVGFVTAIKPIMEMFEYIDKLGGGKEGLILTTFKTVFETVAVLAANIAFIVKGIIEEVQTLYEQAKTVLSNPFNTDNWKKAGEIHEKAMARAKQNALDLEEAEKRILGLSQQQTKEGEKQSKQSGPKGTTPVKPYWSGELVALRQMTDEFIKQENILGAKARRDTANIGLGDDLKALSALSDLTERYNNAQEALIKKRDALAAKPQSEGTKAQIGEINRLLGVQAKEYDRLFEQRQKDIDSNNTAVSVDKIRNTLFNDRIALQERINALTDESAKIGLTSIEKKYYDIEQAAKRAAEAEIRAEEVRRFGVELAGKGKYKLTAEQRKDIEDAAKERAKAEQEAAKSTYENQRTFAAGWKEAFASYAESATNAALQAQTMFQSITRGLEDVIVNFVKTGKFNFKDFANSVIADFARIQARQLVLGIFGGSSGASVMSAVGSALGARALGGPVTGNTPYLVGERGPELFVPNTAGNIVPNNKLSGSTSVTYNINAVDAASFRQMLAREPEFLYAVTERGRNNLPVGSRR